MQTRIEPFGQYKGEAYSLFTMTNARGASASFSDIGCAITSLRVPDRRGDLDDVTLGFPDIKSYINNNGYLGVAIGPVCNRIQGARFSFRGENYALKPNENGKSLLHGGDAGFHNVKWRPEIKVEQYAATLALSREFKHIPGGHPGSMRVQISYTFNDDNELIIDYDITADSPTFVSPTNHAYFNLGGVEKRVKSVLDNTIEIFADKYTQIDADTISTAHAPVDLTPFDLRAPVVIGEALKHEKTNEQLKLGFGYDQNFLLSSAADPATGLRFAARVRDFETGREMRVYTDMPAIQFYSANHLRRRRPRDNGYYTPRQALCLETQFTPNSINRQGEEGFQIAEVLPGKPFHSRTVYAFSII